ncbi:MAG: 3-phosphoshikimate 1-carboxyvinyltransferase, partial [Nitrososphaerota archaeon]|nr:3-phosphoshikimate 1-carboxyvinyltransferase [Nitrososphaerota archaeon]
MARAATAHGVTRVVATGPLSGSVSVPPSKSYTHRAALMASLAAGVSKVRNPLLSRDTNATLAACAAFGARVEPTGRGVEITGTRPRLPDDVVNVENSGTTLRFLTSALSLSP